MDDIILENLTVNYEKNAKNVYIKDERGKIFFIVSLITLDQNETWENMKYLVKVIEIRDNNLPFDLVRQFFTEEEKTSAVRTFKNMVRDYQVLVIGPIQEEVDPREIFNETVNYRKIDTDRCENCCFCVFHPCEDVKNGEKTVKILCSCKKNLRTMEYDRELFQKCQENQQEHVIGGLVEVEKDHICDNFSKVRD